MIFCFKKSSVILQGFSDANSSGDIFNSPKSIINYVFTLDGTNVSWMSLSTVKTEHMTISKASKKMI